MKSFLTALALFCSVSAFASPDCKQSPAIRKAAEKQARIVNGSHETSAGQISYTRTTKNGKDMYTVEMSVNEECIAEVYVYTNVDTCDVTGAAGGELQDGACG